MNTGETTKNRKEKTFVSAKDPFKEIISTLDKYEESTPRRTSVIDSGE